MTGVIQWEQLDSLSFFFLLELYVESQRFHFSNVVTDFGILISDK